MTDSLPPHAPPSSRLETGALLGKGFTSDVYAWGAGRVLKLFHPGVDAASIEREFRVTQAVHAAGQPAPAAYELLDVDGRRGIVFEQVEGVSLFKQVQSQPWKLLAACRQLAELHAQVHACRAPAELPSQRQWIAGLIDAAANLSASQRDHAHHCLSQLPDGTALCHGDFHPDNIIYTKRGPVIIDWGAATRGHPLGDVACTSRLMQTANLPSWSPWHAHLLLAVSRTFLHRTYLNRYLQLHPASRHEIEAWQLPLAAAALGWRAQAQTQGQRPDRQ